MRAILIDDEQLMLDLLERKLQSLSNIEVIGKFTNPHEGLVAIIKNEPDILFLDIEMPGINGVTLAKEVRKELPKIKVIFITAFDKYAVEAFEIQANDYIMKPLTDQRLLSAIEKISTEHIVKKAKVIPKQMICCFKHLQFKIYGENEELINVNWRTKKARELFAFLVHHRGEFVRKDVILERFWDGSTFKDDYANMYTTIYQIRQLLKSIGFNIDIRSSENSYKLELNDVVVDVDLFKEGIAKHPFINGKNIKEHKRIVDLYQGEYYEEEDFSWLDNTGQELHIIWLNYVSKIVEYLMAMENYGEAIILYLKIQRILPYKEESYFMLMKLYDLYKDRYSVQEQYHRLKEMLKEEYDLTPNPEITEWYESWTQNTLENKRTRI